MSEYLCDLGQNLESWPPKSAWLDVLNAVRRLGKKEFTTSYAYAFAREMEKLHPDNRHVKDKIRQQLQVLRDTGFLSHPDRGVWTVK